jgi:hypothetical protein
MHLLEPIYVKRFLIFRKKRLPSTADQLSVKIFLSQAIIDNMYHDVHFSWRLGGAFLGAFGGPAKFG